MKYAHLFQTRQEHDAAYSYTSGKYKEPWVANVKNTDFVTYNLPPIDWSQEYLTILAIENTSISNDRNYSYSTDGGNTWQELTANSSISVNAGNTVMFKRTGTSGCTFASSGRIEAMGNAFSMAYGDDFREVNDVSGTIGILNGLFKQCSKLVSAKNLSLPAMILGEQSYDGMFYGCTSLVEVPKLPATTLANYCYRYMFQKCSGLTTPPELPAEIIADRAYFGMFSGCLSLTTAPELRATSLDEYCYGSMFSGCTSLRTAPDLPATTLRSGCYTKMFYYCSSLNYIKMLATDISASSCLQNWVSGVAQTGTFVKNSAAQWSVTGASGIPSGWTVQTASS